MVDRQAHVLSLGKSFALLGCLKQAGSSLSLKELAERTGFPKSTIHNLLSTMREFKAIEQDIDGRYRLGTYLFELGCAVEKQWNISKIAQPYLESICANVNESVSVGVLDGHSVLILNSIVASNPMRVITDIGTRLPIHATASGKVILAYMSDDEVKNLIGHSGMASFTPHTICDIHTMNNEIGQIREKGYAVENGEIRVGMRAVAAPIFDINGIVKYSISVTGMFRKIDDETLLKAMMLVVDAAAEITKRMR